MTDRVEIDPEKGCTDTAMAAWWCVFCAIVEGRAPATVVREWADALAIRPRRPIVEGHVLVLPRVHVQDVGVDPGVSAAAMTAAAELAGELDACNVITSRGAVATQTVWHLHLHVVPRAADDGLALPWTERQRREGTQHEQR